MAAGGGVRTERNKTPPAECFRNCGINSGRMHSLNKKCDTVQSYIFVVEKVKNSFPSHNDIGIRRSGNATECCGKQSNSFADENLATADFCAAPPKLVSFDCPQTTVSSFRRRKMRNDTLRTLPPTFSAKRLIRSNPTQKTFDRAFKELQNDVQDD